MYAALALELSVGSAMTIRTPGLGERRFSSTSGVLPIDRTTAASAPTAAIFPSRTETSPTNHGAPVPSTTRA